MSNPTEDAGTWEILPHRREDTDVEERLVDALRGTHPVRIGRVLRRLETEVMLTYPADEAANLLRRAIVAAVGRHVQSL